MGKIFKGETNELYLNEPGITGCVRCLQALKWVSTHSAHKAGIIHCISSLGIIWLVYPVDVTNTGDLILVVILLGNSQSSRSDLLCFTFDLSNGYGVIHYKSCLENPNWARRTLFPLTNLIEHSPCVLN
ncbi:hypothetical protein J6590_078731 [Homalodisca vitripennis]|nr:hypothetical protein J6590_078731 [Homalodisca vitripennis]